MQPKVSAIVSAYYAEEYLGDRLRNLKAADAEPVVICQKGSAEHRIARSHEAVIVTTPDIPTIGTAWNFGIMAANGDYLTTANCDDTFKDGGLQIMADILDVNPEVGIVFSNVDIIKGEANKRWTRINEDTGVVPDIYPKLQERCFIGPMPVWRRALHEQHGYFDDGLIVSCDYDYWLRLARGGVNFYHVKQALGTYLRRSDSLEHRNRKVVKKERDIILERLGVMV